MAYIGKAPGVGIRNRFIFTATAGQTVFSGVDDYNLTLSYTDAQFTDVFLNGVKLDKTDYTATSGTSIVLAEAAALNDTLEVLAFDTFSVFSGEFSQDVTVGGTITTDGLIVDTNTLYVDSTNNLVGIGTSSPTRPLTVNGNNGAGMIINDATNDKALRFRATGDAFYIEATNNAESAYANLALEGNVGIGTALPDTSPSTKLHIREDDAVDYKSRAVIQASDQRLVAGSHWQSGVAAYSYLQATNDAETVPNTLLLNPDGGSVGIGTASPIISGSAFTTLNVKGNAFNTGLVTVTSNDLGSSVQLYSGNSSSDNPAIAFQNNLRFGSATDAGVGGFSERIRILSSGGITFNGDTSTANALDDYEEGTWTPTVEFSGVGVSISLLRARYIKIGGMVTLSASIDITGTPSSGYMAIKNIPFSPNANIENVGSVMAAFVNTVTGTMNLNTYNYGLSDSITIYQSIDAATWVVLTNSHVGSGSGFIFTHTYYTA